MVNTPIIKQLLERKPNGLPVLSLYLDMSVGPDNKRSHLQFLNKQRSALGAAASDTERRAREGLPALFDRIEEWLEAEYQERNHGVAIFAEPAGGFFHAVQLPKPVANLAVLQDRPLVAPLAEALENERRWAILLVDRESIQLIATFLEQVEEHEVIAPETIPVPHSVQAGGYSQKNIQKRKAEETRHFFKQFAEAVGGLDQRRRPEGYAVLGTTENVTHFLEFLPPTLRERVVHTGPVPTHLSPAELVQHLAPTFRSVLERREAEAVHALLERVRTAHFATSGFHDTLVQLQEGKVDTLIISRDAEHAGVQCTQCGFTMVRRDGGCPFCGGELREGVDLVESMIRMAAQQDARVEFVSGPPMDRVHGVGALLRF